MNASSGNKQYNKVCEKRAQRVKMQKKFKKKKKTKKYTHPQKWQNIKTESFVGFSFYLTKYFHCFFFSPLKFDGMY